MIEFFDATLAPILASTLRSATPLIIAALAGLLCERSGIVNIALEGKMLGAAFMGFAVSFASGSPYIGLLAAVAFGLFLAALHAIATVSLKGDQVVSGVAINMLAAGLTAFLYRSLFKNADSGALQNARAERFFPVNWPGAEAIAEVPLIGSLYSQVLSGHVFFIYLALLLVPLIWWLLYRSRFGLRLRACGDAPEAADTTGVSVVRMRYTAVLLAGLLCGLAGAYLTLSQAGDFKPNMTASRGYIALAALIFARWRPVATLFSCLLFGFFTALSDRLQSVSFAEWITDPNAVEQRLLAFADAAGSEFFNALPYALTVVALALFAGRAIAPRALGTPYSKERG